ncbi:uncharacterized protein LOC143031574 [Oratosquilla oratoria]|uniref:uncharacterized protein LOC143031574 n=1 Tax=Oratosquilla oratoria TaxID=337810 RepID=UPI003F76BE59
MDKYLEKIFEFQKDNKVVLKRRSVPTAILNKDNAFIIDVIINAKFAKLNAKSKGFGPPEDWLYSEDEQIRTYIPRGLALLEVDGTVTRILVCANKKFSGHEDWDEEEDEGATEDGNHDSFSFEKFFDPRLNAEKTVSEFVCLEKMNGEAAHISCFERDGDNEIIWVFGSKRRHILARDREDVLAQMEELPLPCKVGLATFKLFSEVCQSDKLENLQRDLARNNWTLVAELMQPDYGHVVPIHRHFKENELVFLTCTPASPYDLTIPRPFDMLARLKDMGMKTAEVFLKEKRKEDQGEGYRGAIDSIMERVKTDKKFQETEGVVVYMMSKDCEHTIGLLKAKSSKYIVKRAIRVKTAYFVKQYDKEKKLSLDVIKKSMADRVTELNASYVQMGEEFELFWIRIAQSWVDWFFGKEIYKIHDFTGNFPRLWCMFEDQ